MFLTIITSPDAVHMGYILCKNPGSGPFSKEFGSSSTGSRRVVGKYLSDDIWDLTIVNDEVFIQQQLKDENKPHYLSSRGYAVNPMNLKGVTVALKSAIDGVNTSKGAISDDAMKERRDIELRIGPFTVEEEFVREMFVGLGFTYENINDTDTPLAIVARLTIRSSITEALQRLTVGAYALTTGQNATKELQPDLVRSLIKTCRAWLNDVPMRDRIISRLVRWNADLRKEFEKALTPEDKVEDEAEGAEPKAVGPEREDLHRIRHDVVLSEVTKVVGPLGLVERPLPGTSEGDAPLHSAYILDLGAGDGKLTIRLVQEYSRARVVAIDGDARGLERLRRKTRGAYLRQDNIIAPHLEENLLRPDVLVLSEVIEHLTAPDRRMLIQQIARMWRAGTVILTTPNCEYNPVFGMEDGMLRHRDHKVEYDRAGLYREVIEPLANEGYDVRIVNLLDETYVGRFPLVSYPDANLGVGEDAIPPFGALIQPSFVVVATRRKGVEEQGPHLLHRARDFHAPLHIMSTGYTVDFNEMLAGLTHPVWMGHRQRLAWLAPTVPPVEYTDTRQEYLEHPDAAFKYFADRRVRHIVGQRKYMGSRATVVAFSSIEAANRMGFEDPITVTSRQGFPFFSASFAEMQRGAKKGREPTRDELALAGLYHDLLRSHVFESDDCVILDCEALPWSYKAGIVGEKRNLIDQEFRRPIHAMLTDARHKDDSDMAHSARLALDALTYYDRVESLRFVPFNLLFMAKVDMKESKFIHSTVAHLWSLDRQMRWLSDRLFNTRDGMPVTYFEPCIWHEVDLGSDRSRASSVLSWEEYTDHEGGEGFVYKPLHPSYMPDGAPIQRALKVRGPEYLRIIYGPRYLEPAFFNKLIRRNVGKKRRLALQEGELANAILLSFMRQQLRDRDRYVAAFLGVDGVQGRGMDATL